MSKRMVTYGVTGDDKIASIDGHELGSGSVVDKSISRRMITYKVDDAGKITSIDGHELNGGGGDYQIKELVVTGNGVYEAPKGTGYSPVKVNVKLEGNPLQYIVDNRGGDGVPSCKYLFYYYNGTSLDKPIEGLDTSKVTNFSHMFASCTNLTSVPALDTSSGTNFSYMFTSCTNLTSVPALDTSNGTNFYFMFASCTNLTSVPALDTSKGTDFNGMFYSCNKLTSIGIYGFTSSIDITTTALEHDAIVAFLNQAGTAYNSSQKITMGSAKLALLSEEEKAIATNKGWQLA